MQQAEGGCANWGAARQAGTIARWGVVKVQHASGKRVAGQLGMQAQTVVMLGG